MDSWTRLVKFAQHNRHVQESIEIIEKALRSYNLSDTCISFNGGKDCTAVLHLLHSISIKSCTNNNDQKILAFYAQLSNHFEEESAFVSDTVKRYNLNLMQYSSKSLKNSLFQLQMDLPNVQAIFIGTRRDDFNSHINMNTFAPTDDDWPKFMRINPILNWSYSQVWNFIRELNIPFCDLYNQGYTSLGTKSNTTKNASLLRTHDNGEQYYLPAWHLTKFDEERLSRSSSLDVGIKNQMR